MTVNLLEKIKNKKWFSIYLVEILALLALFALGSFTIDGFATKQTILATLMLSSFLGIAAGGQTIVILLGAIDLSIPAIMSSSVMLVGYWTGHGWPFYAIVLALVFGALVFGTLSGLISKLLNINAMIVTLATGAIVAGTTLIIVSGRVASNGPAWLNSLSSVNGKIGFIPIPPVVGIWAVYSIITLLLLYKTTWGRRLYATGANDRAAKLALVSTNWTWPTAFIFSSVSAVLAGILLAGFAGSSYGNVAAPYLFTSVGAVVIGGTSTIGGRGGYGRTIFGALIMTLIGTITVGYGFTSALQQAFLGFLIILLMGFYGRTQNVRLRM
jgi:ribose transport system permease protein